MMHTTTLKRMKRRPTKPNAGPPDRLPLLSKFSACEGCSGGRPAQWGADMRFQASASRQPEVTTRSSASSINTAAGRSSVAWKLKSGQSNRPLLHFASPRAATGAKRAYPQHSLTSLCRMVPASGQTIHMHCDGTTRSNHEVSCMVLSARLTTAEQSSVGTQTKPGLLTTDASMPTSLLVSAVECVRQNSTAMTAFWSPSAVEAAPDSLLPRIR
mmetsp:Transcript_21558/g.67560  ORF Transcript_21558/g.67560 Transcript_21558/m.67560 type:complete len:214 (+) Transcript_21558:318-959(+)